MASFVRQGGKEDNCSGQQLKKKKINRIKICKVIQNYHFILFY